MKDYMKNCGSGFMSGSGYTFPVETRRNAAPTFSGSGRLVELAKPGVFTLILISLLSQILSAQMGSPGHGETQAIALHPTNPDILYAGAAKGFCKTLEGGKDNWPVYGLDTLSPRVIAVSQSNPDIIYAGTYEMGVHKSENGASSWKAINNGISDLRIRALVLHPQDDQVVFAGTEGYGIFKTTDGGDSWKEVNSGLIDKVIRSLVIDPTNPDTLYAGTWHGVYTTKNGARSWSADPDGLFDIDVRVLALDPTDSHTIYAGTQPRGIFRSEDGGKTWVAGAQQLPEHIESMAIDPVNPRHVYVGTKAGVFLSKDRGDHFKSAGLRWSNHAWTLAFDPKTSPPTLYYGGVGGVLKTINEGLWWEVTGPKHR
jgi:photosystem II stability/assembly factor-like uncharacterized protein